MSLVTRKSHVQHFIVKINLDDDCITNVNVLNLLKNQY